MVWQGWAILAHLLIAFPPSFFTTIPILISLPLCRLGPLSKAPSSWEQAGFKCLSHGVIEVATHRVSSVTTQAGLCQGQNEFVGGREVVGGRDILQRMMNTLKVRWYFTQTMKRLKVKRWKTRGVGAWPGCCCLWFMNSGCQKGTLLFIYLLLFCLRNGEGQVRASAFQLCYVTWINAWYMPHLWTMPI